MCTLHPFIISNLHNNANQCIYLLLTGGRIEVINEAKEEDEDIA